MPAVVVKGAIIVVSVAVAAAIAVYESPQARQFAEDVRRRIAIALHALGDEINPAASQNGEPRFNRPEDAEGFLQSQGAIAAASGPGVEADDGSARRQREELMYWNAIRLEKLARDAEKRPAIEEKNRSRGSSFDDFLHEDKNAEKGTYVYNTGANFHGEQEEGLRNRGNAATSGVRGLSRGSVWANPFGDEHNIDIDEQRAIDASLMSPDESEKYEVLSEGLYSANDEPTQPTQQKPPQTMAQILVDTAIPDPPIMLPSEVEVEQPQASEDHWASRSAHVSDAESAFASIHAWADNANSSFYSPLPTTPRALSPIPALQLATPASPGSDFSDPPHEVLGDGVATPTTDSMSLAGSGDEIWAPRSGATSDADVMSVDGDGISTPGTWTEVGSVVSEEDAIIH